MTITPDDPPAESYQAAAFAESLAKSFESQGNNARELFIVLAGLMAGRDKANAMDCLVALDEFVSRGGIGAPSRISD
jgi:hypothetical protein